MNGTSIESGRANESILVEEGAALAALAKKSTLEERFDVVVIGAGQSGLSVGHHLRRAGLRFVILDGNARVGDAWRKRWDSLRLFTPAHLDGLDGMPFPGPSHAFPTKDEMADYLESYAARFELPVRCGVKVESLRRVGEKYVLETSGGRIFADRVVVAMATYQKRKVPAFGAELRTDIVQLHSSEYRNPGQLAKGPVLIAGAGNSGAEIAKELAARGHAVVMSGRDTGNVPFRMESFWARLFLARFVLRFVFHRVLTIRTPMGRKARPKFIRQGTPLIRVKREDLQALGVERCGRVVGARHGAPALEDGRTLDVANVVWCTGFDPAFSWIDLPIFDEYGEPHHEAGVVTGEPGLYFVGLHFLYAVSSTMIHGVGRDARRIAETIARGAARHVPAKALGEPASHGA